MNPILRDTRPDQGVIVKGDPAYSARLTTPTETVAFRVHYGVECDPSDHRVTDLLWEDEASAFSQAVAAFPGMRLIASESRPDGIESVQGWARPSTPRRDPFPDPRPRVAEQAREIGWFIRDAYLCEDPEYVARQMNELLTFIAGLPEDLKLFAAQEALDEYSDVIPATV